MNPGAKHRVLIVDDEVGMRESCRKLLVSEGFEVETAADGVEGWERFNARRDYSVLLTDLKMPHLGGIELIEKVRQVDSDIVLLVITAFAAIETAVEATKRGAYSYVPKPFTPDELMLPIRNGLERRELAMEARRLREEREKRLLEVAFERSKSNTIIHCMTDGILVVNRERQIVLRNAAAARMIAVCAPLKLPASLEALGCIPVKDILEETLHSGATPGIVSRELTLDSRTYMVSASPVMEPSGETLGAVAVFRDISDLKKLEAAKSMFVSMVAHEIKNPLAVIEGYLNLVVTGAAGRNPERDNVMLGKTLERTRGLRRMISEMMNLRAMETGHFALIRIRHDLKAIVDEAVALHRDQAEARHITLAIRTENTPPSIPVLADRGAMVTVISDLLDNAIKYTPDGGRVDVRLSLENQDAILSVHDTGMGIAPEDQARIFDEFFRVRNKATAQVSGTGLGLSIVKRLVELHEGEVSVRSELSHGSEFTLRLPLAE